MFNVWFLVFNQDMKSLNKPVQSQSVISAKNYAVQALSQDEALCHAIRFMDQFQPKEYPVSCR